MVEGGEDQLVIVDEATEADSELLQFLADWEKTTREWWGGLMLTGLQGSQEVALNPRV